MEIGWKNSCHSLCHLHNETMNIWTHVIACAVMLVLLVITIWGMSPHGVDRLNLNVVDLGRLRGVQTTQPVELLCPLSPGSTDAAVASSSIGNCSIDEPYIVAHHTFMSSLEQLYQSPASYLPQSVTDVYDRLQHHLPNLQHLTRTLRQQATSITHYLPSSPQAKFLSFLNRVEEHLSSLHATVTDAVSMESVARLKALMVENVGGFSPYVTMQRQVDMVRVVRAMMAQYVKTLTEEEQGASESSNHELQPTLHGVFEEDMAATDANEQSTDGDEHTQGLEDEEENIGLALRIKRWAGLGEGDIFFAYSSDDDRILPPPSFKHIHRSLQQEERLRRHAWEEDVQLHFYLPRWPLTVFMVSALCCLFFSAWFHCFQAVSAQMTVVFQCLDYAGITLLIAGSNVPVIYYVSRQPHTVLPLAAVRPLCYQLTHFSLSVPRLCAGLLLFSHPVRTVQHRYLHAVRRDVSHHHLAVLPRTALPRPQSVPVHLSRLRWRRTARSPRVRYGLHPLHSVVPVCDGRLLRGGRDGVPVPRTGAVVAGPFRPLVLVASDMAPHDRRSRTHTLPGRDAHVRVEDAESVSCLRRGAAGRTSGFVWGVGCMSRPVFRLNCSRLIMQVCMAVTCVMAGFSIRRRSLLWMVRARKAA